MSVDIYNTSIFDWILVLSIISACISIIIRGSGRIRYNDVILDKQQRKKAIENGVKLPK